MTRQPSNIVLIGMPGSGKSTIGVIMAKLASLNFVDTDILIQRFAGRELQEIVDTEGYPALRKIEEEIILKLDCRDHVIATGGSAVYSPAAMEHLRADGLIVFLDVEIAKLLSRIRDYQTRGLAKRPEQTFEGLFDERLILYRKYADVTVSCGGLTQDEVSATILKELSGCKPTSL
jgi:shikimate kinase